MSNIKEQFRIGELDKLARLGGTITTWEDGKPADVDLDFHGVKRVLIEKTPHHLEKSNAFVRTISIVCDTRDGERLVELTLFSDERSCLIQTQGDRSSVSIGRVIKS